MDIQILSRTIAKELGLQPGQVSRTIELLDADNTIPFVARYRKEVTGSLDEEQLRSLAARLDYLRKLDERKETVLKTIESQGKLTDALRERIVEATLLQEVEDLYLPFKPKRRTRAMIAREHGLEPLAELMLAQELTSGTPEQAAQPFVNDEVPTVDDALAGARDIVAETVAEDADARAELRTALIGDGLLVSRLAKKAEDPQGKYAIYYEHSALLRQTPPHRILAMNRGESEGVLSVSIQVDDEAMLERLQRRYLKRRPSIFREQMLAALQDGYERLLFPALERQARAERTEQAEEHAIRVFGANLRALLLQSPLQNVRVLALDPGYRTGCKVAVVDETGKFLEKGTIFPHEPRKQWEESKQALRKSIERTGAQVIAIGNGTASRESETLVAEMIAEGTPVSYVMVSEAGASVYSASKLAREEMPDLDVSIRGAVSIARRLQDPLAELVKIEPRSIGVGLYQHDVDQKALGGALDAVVESAVNYVGVDANTASPALLRYVSGLSARVAKAVVAHRDANGPFRRRRDLLSVKGLGAKGFEQAAGFMMIRDGEDALDNTFIHPESYQSCHALLDRLNVPAEADDLPERVSQSWRALRGSGMRTETLAKEIGVGLPTLEDMLAGLAKRGRDPREDLPAPILRTDVLKIEDLREGMVLKGTVRNVVDFGAFVDIGVKQDGLVHISQMADRFVSDPLDIVNVGDVVEVRVLSVDLDRGRVGLSMKSA